MRLVSFLTTDGRPSIGAAVDNGVRDLAAALVPLIGETGPHSTSPMRRLLDATGGDLSIVADALTDAPQLSWTEVTLQAPVPDPTRPDQDRRSARELPRSPAGKERVSV